TGTPPWHRAWATNVMAITEPRFLDRAPWAALEVVKWSPDRVTWIPPHASKPRFRSAVIFPRRISLQRYRFRIVASLSLLSVAQNFAPEHALRRRNQNMKLNIVGFHDWNDYRGLTPDQRQRVMQHVIHAQAARAQAPHELGNAGLRTLQAAAGGGAAIIRIRALAKAVTAAAGKWWRADTIRRAHLAAVSELHALDDRTLRDIGVSRSEIKWVVLHGREMSLQSTAYAHDSEI